VPPFEPCQRHCSSSVPPVHPERTRAAPPVLPEARAAPFAFGSTDTAPFPHLRLDRYSCGHRSSYPAGTGSAASDTPRPARPRRLVHPGLDPGVYPPGWRVHDPVLQLTQHVQQLIVRHDDRGRRRLCHADAIPGLTPAGGDRSRA
jgi:hypothetical protein